VETRRLAEWLEAREVSFLDAPLSGGASAAREGRLSVFTGGQKETFRRCLPLLKALSPLGNIAYCGPAGSGQVVKGVEQLALGLSAAGFLEALAYGASFGIAPAELWEALRRTPLARADFEQTTRTVLSEGGEAVSVHYGELHHILDAASRNNQRLPVARALLEYLKQAPPAVIERGRHVPSFWLELTRKQEGAGQTCLKT
jgi:2-hydroxy-3-oxopropionate reductase